MAIARKTSRLARLLDDETAMRWLEFEVRGYPMDEHNNFAGDGWWAAGQSNRIYWDKGAGGWRAPSMTLGEAQVVLTMAAAGLGAAADVPVSVSVSSANPNEFVGLGANTGHDSQLRNSERNAIRARAIDSRRLIDRVLGSFHAYVASTYQELRFGAAVETAFQRVRAEVDGSIARLVPDGLPKLSAAFEGATSDNPEHWASAAATCRRLIRAAADALQPPGPPTDAREMTEAKYINRLAYWIQEHQPSQTASDMTVSELQHLGQRLDAADHAGHKGAHADVSQFDAARFITGTYLLLGDILRLQSDQDAAILTPSAGAADPEHGMTGGPPEGVDL